MNHDLPEPPIGGDADLRDFAFTPIFRARLFASRFHALASDAEWKAGVVLWLRSWDQVPPGSLPSDDRELCLLADLGRDLRAWKKVKRWALHNWQLHSDGRLYHPVVAEGVKVAVDRKIANRQRTQAARDAYARRQAATTAVTTGATGSVRATTIKEISQSISTEEPSETQSRAGNGHFENGLDDSVGRSAPLRAAGAPLKQHKKELLRQKLMRFAHATKTTDEASACFLGLMGEDQQHSAQWWLDTLAIEMRAKGWSDTT